MDHVTRRAAREGILIARLYGSRDLKPRKRRAGKVSVSGDCRDGVHGKSLQVQIPRPPPASLRVDLEVLRAQRKAQLAYVQSLRYPPRAIAAAQAARLARHYPHGL